MSSDRGNPELIVSTPMYYNWTYFYAIFTEIIKVAVIFTGVLYICRFAMGAVTQLMDFPGKITSRRLRLFFKGEKHGILAKLETPDSLNFPDEIDVEAVLLTDH